MALAVSSIANKLKQQGIVLCTLLCVCRRVAVGTTP